MSKTEKSVMQDTMLKVTLSLLMMFILFTCTDSRTSVENFHDGESAFEKRALLISLNRVNSTFYNGNGYTYGVNKADKDSDTMKRRLKKRGFEVHQLKTEEATKEEILYEIKNISQEMTKGLLVIYIRAHGIQLPDKPPFDESDTLDEAIVTYDGPLIDDTLKTVFKEYFSDNIHICLLSDLCTAETIGQLFIPEVILLDEWSEDNYNLLNIAASHDGKNAFGLSDLIQGRAASSYFSAALIDAMKKNYENYYDFYLSIEEEMTTLERPDQITFTLHGQDSTYFLNNFHLNPK